MGWVTPLGADVASVWSKLLSGASAMGPITRFDAGTFATNFAAEVRSFELADFLDVEARRHTKAALGTKYALAAAAQAWVQSGLGTKTGEATLAGLDPERVGVYLGAGEGAPYHDQLLNAAKDAYNAETRTPDAATFLQAMAATLPEEDYEQEPHMAVARLAAQFNARGPALNCMTACAASTQSVGEAAEILRRGDADVMIAGGSHSMIHPLGMTGFIRLTAMSTRNDNPKTASRPFSRSRDGFVMGEGAGILTLETLEHARARGANILAEVAGYGSSADAYRITDIQPDGAGGAFCMRQALRQAGIDPTRPDKSGRAPVQYISAHGTGTQENDSTETRGVKSVFGDQAGRIPFSSIKSMMGHLIQAAGAVELITCVKAIETGWVPPTINLTEPDAECDLDYVPNVGREIEGGVEVAISNGFGFGGQNDSICVRRFEA